MTISKKNVQNAFNEFDKNGFPPECRRPRYWYIEGKENLLYPMVAIWTLANIDMDPNFRHIHRTANHRDIEEQLQNLGYICKRFVESERG